MADFEVWHKKTTREVQPCKCHPPAQQKGLLIMLIDSVWWLITDIFGYSDEAQQRARRARLDRANEEDEREERARERRKRRDPYWWDDDDERPRRWHEDDGPPRRWY